MSLRVGSARIWRIALGVVAVLSCVAMIPLAVASHQESQAAIAAVIGVPDELTGEGVVAFVVLTPGTVLNNVSAELSAHIAASMGPPFRPRAIRAVPELPRTQSGKVVRRLIRQAYLREPLGDTSTVENPGALGWFDGET